MGKDNEGGRRGEIRGGRDKRERNVTEVIFFFKQKTAYEIKECDWSSDVCSSDLPYGSL